MHFTGRFILKRRQEARSCAKCLWNKQPFDKSIWQLQSTEMFITIKLSCDIFWDVNIASVNTTHSFTCCICLNGYKFLLHSFCSSLLINVLSSHTVWKCTCCAANTACSSNTCRFCFMCSRADLRSSGTLGFEFSRTRCSYTAAT